MTNRRSPGGRRGGGTPARAVIVAAAAIALTGCSHATASATPAGPASTGTADPAVHWVGTWAAAPMPTAKAVMPPPRFRRGGRVFADSTIRQSVHVTAGGKQIRLRFSNAFGGTALPVTKVSVALPAGGKAGVSAIQPGTSEAVTFGGKPWASIPAGAQEDSDPLDFPAGTNANLTVTMYLARGQAGDRITSHKGSRTDTFMATGDHVSDTSLPGAAEVAHWYFLTGVEAREPGGTSAVNAIGDSLTDGRGSTANGDDKWTDQLFTRLRSSGDDHLAVLDQGIGGNRILRPVVGPSLESRLDRDGLGQSGAKWLIVWAGVNDIGRAPATPDAQAKVGNALIAAYQRIIRQAHARGLKVYGATITPFGGNRAYDDPNGLRQATRERVNTWIRTSHAYDAVLDFDKAVQDPSNPKDLNPAYDFGDHLHLNPAGYGVIARSVPASLFQ